MESPLYYSPGLVYYDIGDEDIEEELGRGSPGNGAGEEQQQQHRGGSDGDMSGTEMEREQQAGDARPPSSRWSSSARSPPRSESSVIGDMTVEHTGALDCGICFRPLKPPIYQCNVGHVLCSPCRSKLASAANSCHVCRGPTSFRRCYAMEQVASAVHVPCPHAAHGCVFRPAYHSWHAHAQACAHAPRHCLAEACGFVGSTAALLHHFTDAHGWPCTGESESFPGESFPVGLREGFNFLTAVRESPPDQGTVTTRHVFLLDVARAPFGRSVSAVWLRPPTATTKECELELWHECYKYDRICDMPRLVHSQTSRFEVPCMDPSSADELPDPKVCFQFVIPEHFAYLDEDDACKVTAAITFFSQS